MATIPKHKIVLIGDYNVGKTSMFLRYKTGQFPEDLDERTIRESDFTKEILVDGEPIELTLCDTAGMERFEGTVPPSYFRSASAVIFVYSLDNQESIANVVNWSDSISPQRLAYVQTDANIVRALAGNKNDLDDVLVSRQRAKEVAEICNVNPGLTREISALTGDGFDEFLVAVAQEIMSKGRKESTEGTLNVRRDSGKLSGGKLSGSGCCS